MRRTLHNLAKQRGAFLLCSALLAACGGVQFEREAGVERITPLPTGAEVLVVSSMKEVPSGSQTLGTLRTKRSPEKFVRTLAEKQLTVAAAQKGCDLLADVHENKFDGAPRKSGGTIDEYEWQARCIRTSVAAEAAASPPAKEKETSGPAAKESAKEEPKYRNEAARLQAELSAAKEAAKKAAKLAQEKEDQLREYAENAEKEKKKTAAAEVERQKREKEQAEKEKQRAASDAADKARAAEKAAEKAHAAAESAEKDRKKLVAEASEKAKVLAEAPTPANFKAVTDAGEKVRVATENAERLKHEAEQADKEAKKAGEFAQEKAKSLDNDKARAEALERERKAKEESEKKAKEEADRKAKDDADRKAKDEADRKAKEEADRKAKESGAKPTVVEAAAPVPVVVDRAAAARAEKEAKAAIAAEKKRQEAEKKRLEAEAKRQEAERKKAEAAEKKRKSKEPAVAALTDVDVALKDGSVNALLAHLALRPEADARVMAALDKRVADTTAEWVSVEGVVVSTVEDERGPKFDADAVAKDVEEQHATGSKFLTPREYSYRYTLRNPASRPVSLEVDLPGQRLRRVLQAGQQVVAQATVACIPHGAVTKKLNGPVLEYHFECNADNVSRVVAVRPVERELLLDRRAADAEVPLEVISRIWQALPATALTSQYVAMVDEILRRRTEAFADFQGRLATQHKTNPDAPTPALVTIRNASQHDATVVFDVGMGREQRLIVSRGQTAEMKLDVPAPATPELKILAILPRLRALDWLLGVWSFKGARMVLLPAERGQWTAFLLPAEGGRVTAVGLHVNEGVIQARANLPAAFVKALYGADTPGSCDDGCEVRWMLRVAELDQYVTGAGRALQVEFDAGDRRAVVKFAAEH